MPAQGNIVDHEFEIEAGGTKVAEVSKKWFLGPRQLRRGSASRARRPLMLAIAECIDQMALG